MKVKLSFYKYLLLILLFGTSLASSQAQQKAPFQRQLHFGAKGTTLASKYMFVPSVSQNLFLGYGGGIYTRFDIERGASLQVELNYTLTGWKEKDDDKPDFNYTRSIHTINLPILTHLYLSFGKGIRVFLNAGPVIGYNFAETNKLENKDGIKFREIDKYRHETKIKNKFFWGLCGGLGLSIPVGKHHRFELEGRYTFGLGDIWSNKRQDPYGNSAERRYSLSLGYSYRL